MHVLTLMPCGGQFLGTDDAWSRCRLSIASVIPAGTAVANIAPRPSNLYPPYTLSDPFSRTTQERVPALASNWHEMLLAKGALARLRFFGSVFEGREPAKMSGCNAMWALVAGHRWPSSLLAISHFPLVACWADA